MADFTRPANPELGSDLISDDFEDQRHCKRGFDYGTRPRAIIKREQRG
jgi:hypothetical protein